MSRKDENEKLSVANEAQLTSIPKREKAVPYHGEDHLLAARELHRPKFPRSFSASAFWMI